MIKLNIHLVHICQFHSVWTASIVPAPVTIPLYYVPLVKTKQLVFQTEFLMWNIQSEWFLDPVQMDNNFNFLKLTWLHFTNGCVYYIHSLFKWDYPWGVIKRG